MFKKDSILAKYGHSTQSQGSERDPHHGSSLVNRPNLSTTPTSNETKPAPAAKTPTPVDEAAGSRLVVGPNVKLKGAEIDDCDILVVEGRVEATMDSRVLRVAENGAFSGKVGIDIAEVHGRFDGDLTARSQLIIHSTGRVSGTIRYGKILVEEGGEISGDIRALSSDRDAGSDAEKRRDATKTSGVRPFVSSA
jgi:cytoskeletal protein CcmA (bactofilin family)